MGFGNSKKKRKQSLQKEQKKNQKIQNQIEIETKKQKKELKILILGTGESGKSTFIKQMMIIHKGGFTNSDLVEYKKTIKTNLIHHTKILFEACVNFNWEIKSQTKELGKEFLSLVEQSPELTTETANLIKDIWNDPVLKKAYEKRNKFQLPDTANYFLDKIDKIMENDYQPSDTDILFCRIPTTGVSQLTFDQGENSWTVIDVGGQRSERRKWIHQFEDVQLLIYIVALSEYNQKLFEDLDVNRLRESFGLFSKISNNDFFENKNCVVFFNKVDLFEEKIKKEDLKQCFPDYKGGFDFEAGKKFIKRKFLDEAENSTRNIFCHFTCATDTKNVERVIDAVNITVIEHVLKEDGLL
ncbi:guanine nucleotide-binding protein g(o) subunit alpha [Anaeramoeba flamelloides]|uniref:Guanine nucleotide-binding protein g(O) subunit alpha n=1 Tax=Anaeramoeba flamelloides TaxID=1746091 RepID=A0ABQ8XUX8_9EUKA|nr:guanine nucleotide-binding protein g(o) subunit alpha [Anaeramoeba flamelloides]